MWQKLGEWNIGDRRYRHSIRRAYGVNAYADARGARRAHCNFRFLEFGAGQKIIN